MNNHKYNFIFMCTNELQYENGVYNLLYGVQFSNTYTCSSGDKSEGVCVCVEGVRERENVGLPVTENCGI